MKLFCCFAILLILAAATLGDASADNESDEEYAAKLIAECKAEKEEYKDIDTNDHLLLRHPSPEEMCFLACFYERAGLIVNGRFSLEAAIAGAEKRHLTDEAREATIEALKFCDYLLKTETADKCLVGHHLSACLIHHDVFKVHIRPEEEEHIISTKCYLRDGGPTGHQDCYFGCYYEELGVIENGRFMLEHGIATIAAPYDTHVAREAEKKAKYKLCYDKFTEEKKKEINSTEIHESENNKTSLILTACVVENCFADCPNQSDRLIVDKLYPGSFYDDTTEDMEHMNVSKTTAFTLCGELVKNETEKCKIGSMFHGCLNGFQEHSYHGDV